MLSVCLVNCIHKNLRCKVTHYFLKKEEKGYLLRGEVRGKKYEILSMKYLIEDYIHPIMDGSDCIGQGFEADGYFDAIVPFKNLLGLN